MFLVKLKKLFKLLVDRLLKVVFDDKVYVIFGIEFRRYSKNWVVLL